jgi:hypothetical protein
MYLPGQLCIGFQFHFAFNSANLILETPLTRFLRPQSFPARSRLRVSGQCAIQPHSTRRDKWISLLESDVVDHYGPFLKRAFVTKHAYRYGSQLLEDIPLEV